MEADWEILKALLESANENMSLLDCVDKKRAYQGILEKTRVGQTLLSHIESMEGLRRMGGQPLCAQQMTADMARALLTKMKSNRQWLGLPAKLPRVIAFMNLSGEAVLVYSDALALVRVMVCAGLNTTDHRILIGVEELVRFAEMHDASLLLTLALPWQSGSVLHSQYWEIRSIRESSSGELVDGERCFATWYDETRNCSSITQGPPPHPKVIENLVRVYENGVAAVCLDGVPDGEPAPPLTTVAADKRYAMLLETTHKLQKERQETQAETKEMKRKHVVAMRQQWEKAEGMIREEKTRCEAAQRERDRAQEDLVNVRAKMEADNSRLNGEVMQLEEKLKKTEEQVVGLKEVRDAARAAQARDVQTLAHEREQAKLRMEEVFEGSERRVSDLTLRLNSVSSHLAAEKQASERKEATLDGVRCERDALQFEVRQLRREGRCTRALLALGGLRTAEERRVAKKKLDDAKKKADDATHKAQAEKKKAAAARRAADEVVAEARRAAQETATPEAAPVTQTTEAAPVLAPLVTARYVDFSMNTEPLPDPPEVAHLQGLVDAKHSEIEALKSKLLEAESKAGSGGVVFGGDPTIDAILEGLAIESRRIQQERFHAAQDRVGAMHGQHNQHNQHGPHSQHNQHNQHGGSPAYDPSSYYNPMLTPNAYGTGGYY